MLAGYRGHKGFVWLLLARGANVALRDRDGKTALGWAEHGPVAALLEAAGATM